MVTFVYFMVSASIRSNPVSAIIYKKVLPSDRLFFYTPRFPNIIILLGVTADAKVLAYTLLVHQHIEFASVPKDIYTVIGHFGIQTLQYQTIAVPVPTGTDAEVSRVSGHFGTDAEMVWTFRTQNRNVRRHFGTDRF